MASRTSGTNKGAMAKEAKRAKAGPKAGAKAKEANDAASPTDDGQEDGTITEVFTDEDGEETTVVRKKAPARATRRGTRKTSGGSRKDTGAKSEAEANADTTNTSATTDAATDANAGKTAGPAKKGGPERKNDTGDAHGSPVRATKAKVKTGGAGRKPTGVTLDELSERFLQHLEEIGKSRATLFSYSIDTQLLCRKLGGETDVGEITEEQVREYFDSDAVTRTKSGKEKSKLTVDKSRRVARQLLEFALAENIIPVSPVPADAMPKRGMKAADQKDNTKGDTTA